MRVAVIGLGYVGLVTSACLARWGNEVTGIEADAGKLARLAAGAIPVHEPGLAELAQEGIDSGMLRFCSSSDKASVLAAAELVILAVGTHDGNGGWQTETIRRTLTQIGPLLGDESTLAIRSTLPPEFVDQLPELFGRLRADAGLPSIPVLLNPEFTREAHAVHDFMSPSRVVIGIGSDPDGRGAAVMRQLYGHLEAPILVMPAIDASFAKLGSNLFLATKISFANELATLCDAYGATIDHVMSALALDGRIGGAFLGAGVGFGGSCLPHQVKMTVKTARQANIPVSLLAAVDDINYGQRAKVAGLLGDLLPGGLAGARIALLGLTFKPDTDDLRDAPSITIADLLVERGATVTAYDPMEKARRAVAEDHPEVLVMESAQAAMDEADAVVLVTEWQEFAALSWSDARRRMRGDIVLDGRNALDPATVVGAGLRYAAFGRGLQVPEPLPLEVAGREERIPQLTEEVA